MTNTIKTRATNAMREANELDGAAVGKKKADDGGPRRARGNVGGDR